LAASCKNIFAEKLFGLRWRWATTSLTQGKQTLSWREMRKMWENVGERQRRKEKAAGRQIKT